MHEQAGTSGAFGLADGRALPRSVEGALLASSEGVGRAEPGTGGLAGNAGAGREKLSFYTRRAVECSAESAARENRKPVDACPYNMSFAPLEFENWKAVYILNGGTWP